tara:strand:- start:5633 stop:6655 length:1023 start_codon:yes stop_codon:yes gene_type:complete
MAKRQISMVMDLNKCLGCQTCTIACKRIWTKRKGMDYMWWNTVNTMPGRGTPRDWESMGGGFVEGQARAGQLPTRADFGEPIESNQEKLFFEGSSATERLKPLNKPEWGPNWDEDQGDGVYPNGYFFYLPRICNHCDNPACLEACPRKAIRKRQEDGIVVIDEDRCRGYRFCMSACPYKKIYFNDEEKTAQKCIFCFPRLEQGVAPACVRQCPGRLRHVAFRDDQDGPVWKLVEKWKVALPLHEEYGTEPNVFYVPPVGATAFDEDGDYDSSKPRIPDEYLISLFGDRVLEALETVKAEMEKTRSGEKSELMDILIARRWPDLFPDHDKDPAAIEWQEIS